MLYTSYYGNRKLWEIPDEYKVCISQKNPSKTISNDTLGLIPDKDLVNDYKYKGLSEEAYVERYFKENLMKLNPEDVYKAYNGKILLCFCTGFCHRDIIRYWLTEAGFECKEFGKDGDLDELRRNLVL